MARPITITGPDQRSITLNAPDGATDAQIQAKIQQVKANWANIGEQQTTATGAFLTGLGQSAFGFGDEIEAGARALYRKATEGGDIRSAYDTALADARDRVKASASQHPYAYYGGEIGGALAIPGGLAKLGVRGAMSAAAGQGLKAGVKAGMKEGAAYGAAHGFGRSEGGVQERVEGAAGGALLGGGVGGAAPVVLSGLRGGTEALRNRYNAAFRPQDEAARRLLLAQNLDDEAAMAAGNALGPARNADVAQRAAQLVQQGKMGGELRNVDMLGGGENVRALARSAANNSPQGREILKQMTDERFSSQGERFLDFLRGNVRGIGSRWNAEAVRDSMKTQARKANRPAYLASFREGDKAIMSDEIERLTGAPLFRKAMQEASESGKNTAIKEGYGAFNTRVDITPDGQIKFLRGKEGVPAYPNLQYWDEVKRNLDSVAKTAFRQGDNKTGGEAAEFARVLRSELDNAVPSYANTRSQAMRFFQAEDALEAGVNFAKGGASMNYNQAAQLVAKMKPSERKLFQDGYMSEFIDKIQKSSDRRSIINNFAQSIDARNRLALAVGKQKAKDVEAFLYVENLMDSVRQAVQGNSTTARQLMELGLAGGSGMLASGFNPYDPTAWVTAALTYGATRGRAHINQNMQRKIAEMLVSRDPVQVQRATKFVASNPTVLENLRKAVSVMASGAGANAAQAPLRGTVTPDDAPMPQDEVNRLNTQLSVAP